MKRVKENGRWSLFDPAQVSDLCDLYGEEFENRYLEYENDENIQKNTILAKELWKKILTSYFETGMPFLCFKDNANKANPNDQRGHHKKLKFMHRNFPKTQTPNYYKIKITYEDGSEELF